MVTRSLPRVQQQQWVRTSCGTVALIASAVALSGAACSAVASSPAPMQVAGHGSNAGGHGSSIGGGPGYVVNGGSGTDGGAGPSKTCGDGKLDANEQCDDGVAPKQKTEAGAVDTGCSALCQIEANWSCPTPGQPCEYLGTCGNGTLTSNKACDDGNTTSGDGCSGDCLTLEPGWTCRVANRAHQPVETGWWSSVSSATMGTPIMTTDARPPVR
jgi:cysteine-rich repeat protein